MKKSPLKRLFVFPARAAGRFVVGDNFVEGKTTNGVRIAWLGDYFKKYLLPKVEGEVEKQKLIIWKLSYPATDLPQEDEPGVIQELHGRHRTMLAHYSQLLAHKQRMKDFGWLIGYTDDINGCMLAVRSYWRAENDGWGVEAGPIGFPHRWDTDRQIVSRLSKLKKE